MEGCSGENFTKERRSLLAAKVGRMAVLGGLVCLLNPVLGIMLILAGAATGVIVKGIRHMEIIGKNFTIDRKDWLVPWLLWMAVLEMVLGGPVCLINPVLGIILILAGAATGVIAMCIRLTPPEPEFIWVKNIFKIGKTASKNIFKIGKTASLAFRPVRPALRPHVRVRAWRSATRPAFAVAGGEDSGSDPDCSNSNSNTSYHFFFVISATNLTDRSLLSLKALRDYCCMACHLTGTEVERYV